MTMDNPGPNAHEEGYSPFKLPDLQALLLAELALGWAVEASEDDDDQGRSELRRAATTVRRIRKQLTGPSRWRVS